jgi:hypothetical protein
MANGLASTEHALPDLNTSLPDLVLALPSPA